MIHRIKNKLSARSLIFYGLRGVGKTVLLNHVRKEAEAKGVVCVWIEAQEDRSLPAILVPQLRSVLLRLSRLEKLKVGAERALRALAGFVNSIKVKYGEIELGADFVAEAGLADSGDLEADLADLLKSVGEVASLHLTAIIIFVDELQYVKQAEIAALIAALHSANQNRLPVALMAAGLPQLLAQTGKVKSYAERLFEFIPVDRLDREAARAALIVPAEKEGATFNDEAVAEIIRQTHGYPYFLQEWGKHSWDIAEASPIRLNDAREATSAALAELDASFFRVRFDRLTPSEKQYIRAMAELGAGPHRSGDIAERLGRKVTAVAPIRNGLIAKGMLYSPSHGDTAFTVPLFDGFMKRIMPAP